MSSRRTPEGMVKWETIRKYVETYCPKCLSINPDYNDGFLSWAQDRFRDYSFRNIQEVCWVADTYRAVKDAVNRHAGKLEAQVSVDYDLINVGTYDVKIILDNLKSLRGVAKFADLIDRAVEKARSGR